MQSGPAVGIETGRSIGCVGCPLCQTSMTSAAEVASPDAGWWRCTGCGQVWTVGRLRVVAEYAEYLIARAAMPAARPS